MAYPAYIINKFAIITSGRWFGESRIQILNLALFSASLGGLKKWIMLVKNGQMARETNIINNFVDGIAIVVKVVLIFQNDRIYLAPLRASFERIASWKRDPTSMQRKQDSVQRKEFMAHPIRLSPDFRTISLCYRHLCWMKMLEER